MKTNKKYAENMTPKCDYMKKNYEFITFINYC